MHVIRILKFEGPQEAYDKFLVDLRLAQQEREGRGIVHQWDKMLCFRQVGGQAWNEIVLARAGDHESLAVCVQAYRAGRAGYYGLRPNLVWVVRGGEEVEQLGGAEMLL